MTTIMKILCEIDLTKATRNAVGCTEIPLIVSHANSPLPVLDSTRLLARYAVREAVSERLLAPSGGWLAPASHEAARPS